MNAPCLYCKNRVVGCHSNCEKYKLFRKEIDIANKTIRKNTKDSAIADSYLFDMITGKMNARKEKRK